MNRRLLRLDSRIRNQFDLITSRTGWLLTSHAFLLGAIAATLNAGDSHAAGAAHQMMRSFMLITLPLIGLISSGYVWRSVVGAYHIVDKVKKARFELLDVMTVKFGYELTDGDEKDVKAGDRPPKIFPWLLGVVWLGILGFAVLGLIPKWQAAAAAFFHWE